MQRLGRHYKKCREQEHKDYANITKKAKDKNAEIQLTLQKTQEKARTDEEVGQSNKDTNCYTPLYPFQQLYCEH